LTIRGSPKKSETRWKQRVFYWCLSKGVIQFIKIQYIWGLIWQQSVPKEIVSPPNAHA